MLPRLFLGFCLFGLLASASRTVAQSPLQAPSQSTLQAPSQSTLPTSSLSTTPFRGLEIDGVCKSLLESYFKSHGGLALWKRIVDPAKDLLLFRSPTKRFASWLEIEVHKVTKKPHKLRHLFQSQIEELSMSEQGGKCVTNKVTHRDDRLLLSDKRDIDDKKLLELIAKGKGLLYIWSPGMVYSMIHFNTFKNAAMKLELNFEPLADPAYAFEKIQKDIYKYSIKTEAWRPVRSLELTMREYANHFPMSFLYQDGRLHPRPLLGVFTSEILEAEMRQRMNDGYFPKK